MNRFVVSTPSVSPELASTSIPVAGRADLRPQNISDAVIRLAGNSQDGIQTAGAMLARLAGRSDQEVMTYMTIPSTISGGPSIFQVRIGSGEVLSAGDEADFLAAFYQHSYEDHISFLKEGGILLYDSDQVQPDLADKRFVYVGVAITGLTVEALGGTAKDKGKNIFVLGLIAAIFHLDAEKLLGLIRERFGGKNESIVNTAVIAFQAGYSYPVQGLLAKRYEFEVRSKTNGRGQVTMDGNQALAYGLIAAGVRYGAGYPITPWSTVMEILRSELPKYGGLFVQAEDELAAVSLALGFSYSGYLSADLEVFGRLPHQAVRWSDVDQEPRGRAHGAWRRSQSIIVADGCPHLFSGAAHPDHFPARADHFRVCTRAPIGGHPCQMQLGMGCGCRHKPRYGFLKPMRRQINHPYDGACRLARTTFPLSSLSRG